MSEETMELRIQALEETARAYARKHDKVQYESIDLTYVRRDQGGPFRKIDGLAPEDATKDSYLFSVCSSFVYAAIYNTFRYKLCNDIINHTCRKIIDQYQGQLRYSYDRDAKGAVSEKKGIRECLAAMQVGDAFLIENRYNGSYHIMLYISGNKLIHCAGYKINLETGEEKWDSPGAIRVDDRDDFLINMLGDYSFSNFNRWWVINILDAIDPKQYPITPWAMSRLKYPGLDIDRHCSVRRYQTVQAGDIITFTIRVCNDNERKSKIIHEGIHIEEVIPANTTLLGNSVTADTEIDGNKLRWKVTLHTGEDRIFQYSVRVNDDVKPGDEITAVGGKVEEIPFGAITRKVTPNRLDIATCEKLFALTKDGAIDKAEVTGDGVAEWVYQQIGRNVKIPTVRQVIDGLYDFKEVIFNPIKGDEYPVDVLINKENPDESLKAMMAPELIGGKMLCEVWQTDRVLELRGENLYPGDVVLVARKLNRNELVAEQWTLLGGGKAVKCAEGKTEIIDLPYMDVMHATEYFVVLRPYLADK